MMIIINYNDNNDNDYKKRVSFTLLGPPFTGTD